MSLLALVALAFAPGLTIACYVYAKDKYEPEPVSLLLISYLYGSGAVLITLLISVPLELLIPTGGSASHLLVNAFLRVALIEEFSKFIFIRFILYRNKNFNEPFDGIVYAVMVGMGFATLENIVYIFQYGITTGFLRMFTAIPAHATFAVLMGFFLGKAKFEHRHQFSYNFLALGAAVLFHGAYDYFLFASSIPGIGLGAVVSLLLGLWLSRRAIRIHQGASPFRNKKMST